MEVVGSAVSGVGSCYCAMRCVGSDEMRHVPGFDFVVFVSVSSVDSSVAGVGMLQDNLLPLASYSIHLHHPTC